MEMFKTKKSQLTGFKVIEYIALMIVLVATISIIYGLVTLKIGSFLKMPQDVTTEIFTERSISCFAYSDDIIAGTRPIIDKDIFTENQLNKCFPDDNRRIRLILKDSREDEDIILSVGDGITRNINELAVLIFDGVEIRKANLEVQIS